MKAKVMCDKCLGCGNCVALTDNQIFDFNDEGLAHVIKDDLNEDEIELVKEAIEQCPTSAIEEINE